MASKKRELVLEIGSGDYNICRQALEDVAKAQSSVARAVAAIRYGGREVWQAIVTGWEDAKKQIPNPEKLKWVRYYSNGTASAEFDD